MHLPQRSRTRSAAVAAAFVAFAAITIGIQHRAEAADYPTRPITLIVPYPAGGGNDVIENRGGAGSTIGTRDAARSQRRHIRLLGSTVLVDEPISAKVVRKNGDLLLFDAVTFFSTIQSDHLFPSGLLALLPREAKTAPLGWRPQKRGGIQRAESLWIRDRELHETANGERLASPCTSRL